MFVAWGPLLVAAGGLLGAFGFGPGWPGLVLALLCGLVGLVADAGLLEAVVRTGGTLLRRVQVGGY